MKASFLPEAPTKREGARPTSLGREFHNCAIEKPLFLLLVNLIFARDGLESRTTVADLKAWAGSCG